MSSCELAVPLDVALIAPLAATPCILTPHLVGLVQAHDDLDAAIAALEILGRDELAVARLKKRKLALKDEIARSTPPAPA